MSNAFFYIEQLQLLSHPEGGHYKETYRSTTLIETHDSENRSTATSIYFLVQNEEKSHLHRIKSDEQWYYHDGDVLEILVIHKGKLSIQSLGKDLQKGEVLHYTVPAGAWFGSRLQHKKGFALVSCVVAPGFDFMDFELATYKKISREYSAYDSILKEMCIS